jgi:DNA-binding response OmpR family regulator
MDGLILVVDDEPKIVKITRDYLEKDGFRVISAGEGHQAVELARRERPDLIILDLMLPGMDGWEVCRALRRESDTPILMLTARVEESDQIVGLELGADDYITKPFSPRALVARVRAQLRRARGGLAPPKVLRVGELSVNLLSHQVSLGGADVHLTPNEFELLVALARAPGQIFTREQLADEIHGAAALSFDRSIDSHVKNLRRKLDTADRQGQWIETVYGVGYRLKDPD